MFTWKKSLAATLLVASLVVAVPRPAAAQPPFLNTLGGPAVSAAYTLFSQGQGFNPYYSRAYTQPPAPVAAPVVPAPVYPNPYVATTDPYGGYLNGAAGVISAQGQYLINTQQANILKEQVRAGQIDNRRRAFDEHLYEQMRTPTAEDIRIQQQQEDLRRALTNPPETEVWSGKSLNDLLTHLEAQANRGVRGVEVDLPASVLKRINVTTTSVGNAGLLKSDTLQWPVALQTLQPQDQAAGLRQQIEALLLKAKTSALSGQVDGAALMQLQAAIDQLRGNLVSHVHDYPFADYTQATNYLRQLDQALAILKQPDAKSYLDGKYAAKGGTVAQLTTYMARHGLQFAPAQSGQEAAYSALFQAMLRYDMSFCAPTPNVILTPR